MGLSARSRAGKEASSWLHIIVPPMKLDQSSSAQEKGELGRELSAGLVLQHLFLWYSSQGRGRREAHFRDTWPDCWHRPEEAGQDPLPTYHKRK